MSGQLDDTFEQAADFVATHTSSLLQEDLLHLYGCAIFTISVPLDSIFCSVQPPLYTILCSQCSVKCAQATEGPCNATKPAFWDLRAKSKWNAWSKLGDMTKESAMVGYVECLNRAQPGWDSASHESGGGTGKKSGMGPVFSTMAAAAGEDEPGVGEQMKMWPAGWLAGWLDEWMQRCRERKGEGEGDGKSVVLPASGEHQVVSQEKICALDLPALPNCRLEGDST
eukprot:1159872-Pelagomonas_calceolata.AAC.2